MWRFLRIRKDRVFLLAALGLAASAVVAALGYWYFVSPTRLTVAVGPRDGPEARLVEAYGDALVERRKDVRLRLVTFDSVRATGEALQQGRVDLAVVRPDVFLPNNGLTVAILREEAIILIAPAAAKIDDPAKLGGKRLGIISHHEADLPAATALLAHYDLAPPNLTLVNIAPGEVEAAFAEKRIDALGFLAVPVGRAAQAIVQAALRATGGKLSVIPIAEAEAFALKTPVLASSTMPPGALSGRPRLPDEDAKTVSVSYRLMARSELDRGVASKVTQYLFEMRSRIAQTTTAVNLMKAPDNDTATSAAIPNHPGAVDYFNREQMTFMDRYGDWLWLALFAGGGLSSGFAWVAQLFVRKRRELVDKVLDRLLCILSDARAATTVAALDDLAIEIDGLVTHAVRHARRRTSGTKTMSALIMAIDSARAAIADRRRDLIDNIAEAQAKRSGPARAAGGPA
jgi:TRAP-type uncharacterized transport system substrate-binding protein